MESRMHTLGKYIETDVLVLGSGAAGCGAAMGAKHRGARVLLVDKGKVESSGCLGGGNDHFMVVLNSGPETDSTEAFIDFFGGALSGYTPRMITNWVKAMPPMVEVLTGIGVEFEKNPDGTWLRTVGFGQPGNWFLNIRNGQIVKRRLARLVRSLGVDVLDHVMVTKLLKENGRVIGAVGFHVLDGSFHILKARAVVLALGNSANRATTNSTGNPYNTWHYPYNTGSQYVLAYEAGAKLINLDLKQQATLLPKSFGSAGMNGINSVGAHELNALGERFMSKYHPMMENGPRRCQILGTHQELIEGNGPPFYMDMRHCDKNEIYHLQNVLMPGDKATFLDYAEQKGIDFARYPMEVELSEIELNGMLLTHDNFESTIPGLFNGCVFPYFSGALCGGNIAGMKAAGSSAMTEPLPVLNFEDVVLEKERLFRPMKVREGISYENFERAVRQVMNYYMGFVRNQKGMETALERLSFLEGHSESLLSSTWRDLMRVNEAMHLVKICQLSTYSTMERKESGRSTYRRSDYPDRSDACNKVLAVWRGDGRMQTAWI